MNVTYANSPRRIITLTWFFLVGFSMISGLDGSVTEWIQEQANVCPYISLCARHNSSFYVHKTQLDSEVPCCQACSCDIDCIERDDCCPDFESHWYNQSSSAYNFQEPAITEVFEKGSPECVSTQYGLLRNNDGYKMVSSCPENFTDSAIKRRCEEQVNYTTANFYRHIPVSNKATGQTFKNVFCKMCNSRENGSLEIWETWLHCQTGFPAADLSFKDPVQLAQEIMRKNVIQCNVVFKPRQVSKTHNSSEICFSRNQIDTCDVKYAGSNIESACKLYTWPLDVMEGRMKLRSYKNYACMRCNDMQFEEKCHDSTLFNQPTFELSLTANTGRIERYLSNSHHLGTDHFEFTSETEQIQKRFAEGNVCLDGFVFDIINKMCRQVLCPMYFYTRDGECVTTFSISRGVFYKLSFAVLLPRTLSGEKVDDVEESIIAGLDDIFHRWVDDGAYDIELWRNIEKVNDVNAELKYFGQLIVSDNEVNYYELLEQINFQLLQERQFAIAMPNRYGQRIINAGIQFVHAVRLPFLYRLPFSNDPSRIAEKLSIVKTTKSKIPNLSATLDISKTSFCYMVVLNKNEYEWLLPGRISLRVLSTKRILFRHEFYYRYPVLGVCLHDAFSNVAETSSYVMKTITEPLQTPPQNGKPTKIKKDRNGANKPDEEETEESGSKSLVGIIGTVFFILTIVSIRCLLKKYRQCRDIDNNEEEMNETINVSTLSPKSPGEDEEETNCRNQDQEEHHM